MNSEFQPTIALRGLPGLGWVDGFLQWPPLSRLPTITGVVAGVAVILIAAGAPTISVLLMIASITIAGAMLAVLVIIARGAETDLRLSGHADRSEELMSSWPRAESAFGHAYGFCLCCLISLAMNNDAFGWLLIVTPAYLASNGTAISISEAFALLSFWCGGIFSVHFWTLCKRQLDTFAGLARKIEVNLLRLDAYQFFSMQFMRYLLLLVSFASLCILVLEFLASPEQHERLTMLVLAPLTLGGIAFGYFFVTPIVIIRNRIRATRLAEIASVRAAIAGDRSRLKDTCIGHIADDFSAPDLLAYEQRLEQLWDWPIQGNVQRLVLYVALPPIAWVLAALVERMVDSLL